MYINKFHVFERTIQLQTITFLRIHMSCFSRVYLFFESQKKLGIPKRLAASWKDHEKSSG